MSWRDWIQHNADKLLLIVVLHGMMIMLVENMSNPTFLDWIKGEMGTVLGALLMLITGRASAPTPTTSTTVTATTTVADPNEITAANPQKVQPKA